MFHRLIAEKDVPIQLRDGGTVVSDVFRPAEAGRFPVIITLGPYPKDIHFSQWQPAAWAQMPERGEHMHWETVDPDWWVPQGYAVVRCDTRGTGKSPGRPRLLSRQEAEDFYDCIEWAAARDWSTTTLGTVSRAVGARSTRAERSTRTSCCPLFPSAEGAVNVRHHSKRSASMGSRFEAFLAG